MQRAYLLFFYLLCYALLGKAQNMQVLYDFDQLPQTLLLNPGSKVDQDWHLGIPFLSNLYLDFGSSNASVHYDNLINNTDEFDDVLTNLYGLNLGSGDFFVVNQQIEVLNAGFRLNDPSYYLSFGMYQKFSGFSTYPVDLADIYFNGNDMDGNGVPEFNSMYAIDDMNTIGELVGVFHVGINKKFNEKFTLGGRLKILSASIGLDTRNNQGNYYLTLDPGAENPYVHHYENLNVRINSSGLLDPSMLSSDIGEVNEVISALFFIGGNFGVAMDLGFTYDISEKVTITGSLLDIGMVSYSNKLTTIDLLDDEISTSTFFDPTEGEEFGYWKELYFAQLIPMYTEANKYIQWSAAKLNTSVRYNTYRKRSSMKRNPGGKSVFRTVACEKVNVIEDLESAAGVQLFAEFQPGHPLWAVTAFYSREFTRQIHAKFTYTADEFSATNLGMGLSLHFGVFNFHMAADNLLALPSIRKSNYQSFQIGMNLIY